MDYQTAKLICKSCKGTDIITVSIEDLKGIIEGAKKDTFRGYYQNRVEETREEYLTERLSEASLEALNSKDLYSILNESTDVSLRLLSAVKRYEKSFVDPKTNKPRSAFASVCDSNYNNRASLMNFGKVLNGELGNLSLGVCKDGKTLYFKDIWC